ncbi:MFS transporter [Niveibacterium terrae]|uniref:MFS transporter n=1 Tax=Niveibacterium terrae TaxID=3373598 RepID=UPI003A91FC97
MPHIARALHHRNYRLYFSGQLVSLAGTWMQQIAMGWLTYRITNSAWLLGVVAFASQIPMLVLGPLGGLWSDRFDRRKLLIAIQILAMLQATALAIFCFTGSIEIWHLIGFALLLGCINAVDMPTRQALATELVDDPQDLPNAIALNSFMMNAGRMIGPSLAGIAVAMFGEGFCFVINAASYLAVICALAAIRTRPRPRAVAATLKALHEGFRHAWHDARIRDALMLVSGISFFGTSYTVLLPVFARDIHGGGPQTYGLLMACSGLGAVGGAIFLASQRGAAALPRIIAGVSPLVGAAVALFGFSTTLWTAAPALALAGFAAITSFVASNTLIQTLVPDSLRGRVMSLYSMCLVGVSPLGSLVAGASAERFGVRTTLGISAALVFLAALHFGRDLRRRAA